MSAFDDHSDRVLMFVAEGLNLTEACERAGVAYRTARKWIEAGRRSRDGKYGPFALAFDARPAATAAGGDTDARELGQVEQQVEALIGGRALEGEQALGAAQARALARAIDGLAATPGGASATAMATASRRLDEVVVSLAIPQRDRLSELQDEYRARRAEVGMQSANGGGSQ